MRAGELFRSADGPGGSRGRGDTAILALCFTGAAVAAGEAVRLNPAHDGEAIALLLIFAYLLSYGAASALLSLREDTLRERRRRAWRQLRDAIRDAGLRARVAAAIELARANFYKLSEVIAICCLVLSNPIDLPTHGLAGVAAINLAMVGASATVLASMLLCIGLLARPRMRRTFPEATALIGDAVRIAIDSLFVLEVTTATSLHGFTWGLAHGVGTIQLALTTRLLVDTVPRVTKAIAAYETSTFAPRHRLRRHRFRSATSNTVISMCLLLGVRVATLGLVGQLSGTIVADVSHFAAPSDSWIESLKIHDPAPAGDPPSGSLATWGYDQICGSLNTEQPGWGLSPVMAETARRLWIGPGGFGAALDGCWSPPEIVRLPGHAVVAYDAGSISGVPVSIAVVASSGSAAIYLQDGGRMQMVEDLLRAGKLVLGSARFSVGSGDVQLAYVVNGNGSYGTYASVRETKHLVGDSSASQRAVVLTPSMTSSWIIAMEKAGSFLWPQSGNVMSDCLRPIDFVNADGVVFASACPSTAASTALSFTSTPTKPPMEVHPFHDPIRPSSILTFDRASRRVEGLAP